MKAAIVGGGAFLVSLAGTTFVVSQGAPENAGTAADSAVVNADSAITQGGGAVDNQLGQGPVEQAHAAATVVPAPSPPQPSGPTPEELARQRELEESAERMAGVFAAMQASDAANVLKHLQNQEIVAILRHLNTRKAAEVLSELEAERAAILSRMLLNASVGLGG